MAVPCPYCISVKVDVQKLLAVNDARKLNSIANVVELILRQQS
ncbi:hypothetical protein [Microcoleus sp. CAWBG556]|nr:hypothetical protein [Microcoleus sp. CAWBG556]